MAQRINATRLEREEYPIHSNGNGNSNGNGHANGHLKEQIAEMLTRVRRDSTFDRIINVLTEEFEKVPDQNTMLLLVGSIAQGHFRKHVSDIDLVATFAGKKHNMPYVDLDDIKKLTSAVKSTIKRLDEEGIYVVAVPPYEDGLDMLDAARGKIAAKKGLDFDGVHPIALQLRLYPSIGEGVLTESLPDLLRNMFLECSPLVGKEHLGPSLQYVSSYTSHGANNSISMNRILAIRGMIANKFAADTSNMHLRSETQFKKALGRSKDIIVETVEEYMKSQGKEVVGWSLGKALERRDLFDQNTRDLLEVIQHQRELISNGKSPTITGEELYEKTAQIFNYVVSQMFKSGSLSTDSLVLERRA
ncbi:MAG: hypothetical protein KGH64_01405 [Candidatus Micrarchaeota archaeon]|nr:hypothetical protein [Candidatus Micrarchaeota archaeon]MDE1833973.1 hypothetical protein [Candidatus Micrarchaeota archaeon]MDE1860043.1 hypothetical protein [Candidatus Micrarchaeota archaeon]